MTDLTRRTVPTAVAATTMSTPRLARWRSVAAAAQRLIDQGHTPGVQICIREAGRTLYSRGFGLANLETSTSMTPGTILRIASITKSFTAALILQLAQEGKLNLEDSLSRFLPSFPRAGEITLKRMLNHTSGLGTFPNPAAFADVRAMQSAFRLPHTTKEVVEILAGLPGRENFEPGADWGYSNIAYLLLGAVIENTTGKSYAAAIQERLIAPAGLKHTGHENLAEVVPGRGAAYAAYPQAASGFVNAPPVDNGFLGAAGGLRSTASDLCLWFEALLGGKVLSPALVAVMLEPARLADGSLPKLNQNPTNPPIAGPDGYVRYGFGLILEEPSDGSPWIWHAGLWSGVMGEIRKHAQRDITWAFLLNGSPAAVNTLPPVQELVGVLNVAALA